MRSVVCFVFLLPLVSSLQCYIDIQHNFRPAMRESVQKCPEGTQFCLSRGVSGRRMVSYTCDDVQNPTCHQPGCRTNHLGEPVCCCTTDHCNMDLNSGSSSFLVFSSLIVLLVTRF